MTGTTTGHRHQRALVAATGMYHSGSGPGSWER